MTAPTPPSASSTTALPRIFVSHSHKDNAFCRPFVAHLRTALGLADPDAIFYDETALHYGDEWLDRIQREVMARPVFLVILTPNSVEADYVGIETRLALRETIAHRQTRLLIPLLAEECDPNRLAPVLLDYQMADFAHRRYDTAFEDLVAVLRTRIGAPGSGRPPAATPPAPVPVSPAPPADPHAALVARLLPGIREAAARQDWSVVIDKGEYVLGEVPAARVPTTVYSLVGKARFELGDMPAARQACDAALARDGTDTDLLGLAARVCLRVSDPDSAAAYLKRALALVDEPAARLDLLHLYAEVLLRLKQWSELDRRAAEALRLAPNDLNWFDLRRRALLEQGQDGEALALLRTMTARPDAFARWWLDRARLARTVINDDAEVRAALDAAERLAMPNDPAVAAARRELFPPPPPTLPPAPPLPADQFPERLATLGFAPQKGKYPKTGKDITFIVPPTVPVPAGPFQMGTKPSNDPDANYDGPPRTVDVAAFAIARYPVTVAEYACFVRAGQREPSGWQDQLKQKLDHPVVYVTWHDATAYAAWLASLTSQPWRLPTEEEWEKAARWDPRSGASRLYPWGDTFDAACCNTLESNLGTTTPVGKYGAAGASSVGAEEMAGNVWEWTSSPYSGPTDNRMVFRGGSWDERHKSARATFRNGNQQNNFRNYIGFRLAVAPVRAGS